MDPVNAVDVSWRGRGPDRHAAAPVSLARLYLLRAGYLFFAVGLVVTKWPLLIGHDLDWPLIEGVETSILVAFSLLAFLGIRYPLRMLPILLLECLWKLIWVTAVALPLWSAGRIDEATAQVIFAFLFVLPIVAVIPWDFVISRYVTGRGDRWRPDHPSPTGGRSADTRPAHEGGAIR
jgi:hypothetical protein